jgi:hypothetical protein
MVQFVNKFFLGFLQFLLGFSKVPAFFMSLCIYSYGMVRFTCISVSSPVDTRVCSNTLLYLLDIFLKTNPWFRKM